MIPDFLSQTAEIPLWLSMVLTSLILLAGIVLGVLAADERNAR